MSSTIRQKHRRGLWRSGLASAFASSTRINSSSTAARSILRIEPLEQRCMLTVLGLDVEFYSDSALSQPIAGDGDPIMETFVVQPGEEIFARITAEDLAPSQLSPGIVALNLDVSWNRDEVGVDAGDFMRVSDPPGNFGNPLPIGSPALTAALPENRQGMLDNSLSRIDFLGGDIANGGTPIGIDVAETFSQIGFAQSDLGILSTVLTVGLGACDFADGSHMAEDDITPHSVRIRMNQSPLAVDHSQTSNEDAAWPLVGNVLTGCSDPEGTLLAVDGFQNPSTLGATVDIDAAGNYTYTPTSTMIEAWQHLAVGESLTDTFTYDILDEEGGHATGMVTVIIEGRNDPPVAEDDTRSSNEDQIIAGNVLTNDSDVDNGDSISVSEFEAVSAMGATVNVTANGSFIYDPTNAPTLQALSEGATPVDDTFTYTLRDILGDVDTATVTITISGVNDTPVANPDTSTTTEDDAVSIDVLDNDTDIDTGDTLSVSNFDITSTLGATITLAPDGSLTYDPTNAPTLQALPQGATPVDDTFTYSVQDGHGGVATATVTVTVSGVNDTPVAVDDYRSTTEDEPISIDVLTNDTDVDTGHILSLLSFDSTSQYQATITRDPGNPNVLIYNPLGKYHYDSIGNIVYDPAALDFFQSLSMGQSITDTFSYTVEDEHHATATATVSVNVVGLNDPEIVAVKWEDLDGNNARDPFESDLAGWTIFADLNHNGQLDATAEPQGLTDAAGEVLFEYMLPGEYTIYEIIPDVALGNRWAQTLPGQPSAPLPHVLEVGLRDNILDPPTSAPFGNRESLHIMSSSILQNDVVAAGDLACAVVFNRNLARQDWSDPAVWGHYFQLDSLILGPDLPLGDYINDVTLASGGDQDPSMLIISFANLPDDSYTLTLKSGVGGFEDLYGNLLDGERDMNSTVPSGDALEGGDFILHFVADLNATDYPTQFQSVDPLGSSIYVPQTGVERGAAHHIDPADGTVLGYIGPAAAPYSYDPNKPIPADDTDSYVVSLDGNQTLTLIVEPLEPNYIDPADPYSHDPHSPMLSPAIELRDPNGTLMATLPTTGVDPERLIQTAAIDTAGNFTITVAGTGGTLGAYRLQVTLNAAVEEESLARGPNDLQAQAQDLDPSFIRLFDQILLIPETGDLVQDSLAATPYIRPEAVSDPQSSDALSPRNHAILDGVLYYAAADSTGTYGAELWSYDGQNHTMVADINPGTVGSYPSHFAVWGHELYFSAYDSQFGYELWKFDGDTVTRQTDINPGQASSRPMYLTIYNDRLYFSADDGTHGSELWQYTPAHDPVGTVSMVEDFNDYKQGEFGSLPGPMTVFDGKLYFSADAGVHDELNNDNIHGFELCVFDAFEDSPNSGKIKRVRDINPGMPSSHVQDIVVFGDEMFFRANDGTNGWEAFKLDKSGNLEMLPDLNAGDGGSWPGYFTLFRNRLFVVADIEGDGWQLLEYDGQQFNQAQGTGPGTIFLPDSPTVAGQYMFFSAQSQQHGRELWAYDGFEMFLVDDFTPGTASTFDNSSPYRGFATLGEELFFRTFDYSGMLRYVPPTATAQYHETTSTRGAVVGTIGDNGEQDWYSFTLEDGQTFSVALDFDQSAGAMSFAIYRGTTQLAVGVGGIDNLQLMVENIMDDTTDGAADTYYVVVEGTVPGGDYQLVVTRDATFDAEPNDDAPGDALDKAQTLPPAGVALGSLQADEFDYYKLNATRGDTILVETSTPADGVGQFINTLDPAVELLDPETGQWIAGENNSPDGRNGWVRLRALSDGTYIVRVSSSGGTAGEYVLNARLNPDAAPKPLYVTTTTMPADESVAADAAIYDLDNDGRVGLGDLALFASVYQQSVVDGSQELVSSCDFDGSGKVTLGDLAFFAQNYNQDVSQVAAAVPAPPTLETQQLRPVVAEAVSRMAVATGIPAAEIVDGVNISIVDLPGNLIGRTLDHSIQIDTNAAANGWFIDQTPGDDVEFAHQVTAAERSSSPESDAAGRADLLTTVMHELGHVLGLTSTGDHDLMNVLLPLGTRRLLDDAWIEEPATDNTQSAGHNSLSDELLDELFAEIGQG